MELIYIAGTAFVVALSGAMMPGPLLTVTITETARRGFMAGPLLVLGHGLLEIALILALVLGLAAFLTLDVVGKSVAIIGGGFLVWMGIGMARDAFQGKIHLVMQGGSRSLAGSEGTVQSLGNNPVQDRDEPTKEPKGMHPVAAGILVSLANPYWILWWATIGLGYITLSLKQGSAGIASFFGGHIAADLVWYSLVSAAVVGSGQFLSPKVYRGIIIVCGMFLVFMGGTFVYYGMQGVLEW